MYLDRSVRYLNALGNASTSRVLNLMPIAKQHGHEDDFKSRPLFQSPVMNSAILLKHRVRADESYLFLSPYFWASVGSRTSGRLPLQHKLRFEHEPRATTFL